jgi:Pyruvate dehydrogenase complex, dehydrogenase (E1) component
VIVQHGLERMLVNQEDVFFYLTVMNENYEHPAMPAGVEEGIVRGLYLLREGARDGTRQRVQLLGSGAILREAIAAARLLKEEFAIGADVWSATSFTELRREALEVDRWNMLHPLESLRVPYVTSELARRSEGPFIAATDYMRIFAEQIAPFVPGKYRVLGTDGFGRSDLRARLRQHFEVDRHYIVVAALKALADENKIPATVVAKAIERYGIDPEKTPPALA